MFNKLSLLFLPVEKMGFAVVESIEIAMDACSSFLKVGDCLVTCSGFDQFQLASLFFVYKQVLVKVER